MEKEFIPYEWALELKELGFDEPCFSYIKHLGYDSSKEKVKILSEVTRSQIEDMGLPLLKIPTFSQAFRWFREKYDFHHTIHHTKKYVGIAYSSVVNYSIDEFDTYKEAELGCLKKLIEIVKQK